MDFTKQFVAPARLVSAWVLCASMVSIAGNSVARAQEYYLVQTYLLDDQSDSELIDDYLGESFLPALQRQGVGPVGVLKSADQDASPNERRVVVVIPMNSADQWQQIRTTLATDSDYQATAAEYLNRGPDSPPYRRIQSELLVAMDCMPKAKVPAGLTDNSDRVFELRLYESANERLGDLKVEMFNAGEVPIFLSSGIQPIFIGQAIVGPQTPSLTYLTVYADDDAREAAWKTFRSHPDWKVLSKVAKYQGTVSKIDKFILKPASYSQM